MKLELIILTLVSLRDFISGSSGHNYITVDVSKGRCENKISWEVAEYENIGVAPKNSNTNGISAWEDSCVDIPAKFNVGSVLELLVYMQVSSEDSGIQVEFFEDTKEIPFFSNFYGKLNTDIETGWAEIEVPITVDGAGYIRLLGFINEEDLVIVDSLKLTELTYEDSLYTKNIVEFVLDEIDFESDGIEAVNLTNVNTDESLESGREVSGSTEGSTTEGSTTESISTENEPTESVPTVIPEEEILEETTFWNTLTITLVAVASAAVLISVVTLLVYYAYYLGKSRGTPIILDDVDPQPTRQIPRITNVYGTKSPYRINID